MTEAALQAQEIEESWFQDFHRYSADLLKIQTMEGELIPFKMNEVQNLLHQILQEIKDQGRPVRLVILKARREGVSTWYTGRCYWKTSTAYNRYGMMIAHEPDASDFLFGMIKRYHTHNEWKPEIRYSNKKILEFNNKEGKGLDSAIRVATAGKEDVGAAQLIHYLHLSEVAKWPQHTAKPLLTGILQCVPNDLETEVIFESTAKGIGGEFHERYLSSRYQYTVCLKDGKPSYDIAINEDADENNIYASVFVPWFVFSKYQMPITKDFERTKEEDEFVDLYGLSNEHLQWRRWAIPNLCGGSVDSFMQEYPSNATEAFLSSGQSIFSAIKCMKYKKGAPPPIVRYECQLSNGNWIQHDTGFLRVWKEPFGDRPCVIGADVAEGIRLGDFSCADVVDQLTGEHMAQWHGKISPFEFAYILMWLGKRYNNAWLAPERNNHGLATIEKLYELRYNKIWVEKITEPPNRKVKRYGWVTSRTSKPLIVDNMVEIFNEGAGDQIKCADTFDEMLTFKQDEKGKLGAEDNKFDDRVMSMAIAQYVRRKLPLPAVVGEAKKPERFEGVSVAQVSDPSPLAWT